MVSVLDPLVLTANLNNMKPKANIIKTNTSLEDTCEKCNCYKDTFL